MVHIERNGTETEIKKWQGKQNKFFYRKIQEVGSGLSLCVTLPKQYATELNLDKLSFVRMSRENGRIVVEKVQ